MISENVTEYAGKPVVDWEEKKGITDPERVHYRITLDYDEGEAGVEWTDKFAAFLDDPNASRVTGLVVGAWGSEMFDAASEPVTEAIVAARDRLPNLKALFIGDITYEECEISWIQQSDMTPVLDAYPQLEHFRVRGGTGLTFGKIRHDRLQSLIIETGGLEGDVVRAVLAAHLPELTHLELWLGTENYGGTTTLDDLRPLLSGNLFPKLTYLGLRDSDIADEVAAALATSPLLGRIQTLDLSLGTLGDDGAQSLLDSPYFARLNPNASGDLFAGASGTTPPTTTLQKLDLHHHYVSDDLVSQLKALKLEVDASDVQEDDEDRYVAVGE